MSAPMKKDDALPVVTRIDPHKGYVKGNTAVVSQYDDRLKGDATAAEHRRIADRLSLAGDASAAAEHRRIAEWMVNMGAPAND